MTVPRELQREENENTRDSEPAVERSGQQVVVLGPPAEGAPPDDELEEEADERPDNVISRRRGRDERRACEDDGKTMEVDSQRRVI